MTIQRSGETVESRDSATSLEAALAADTTRLLRARSGVGTLLFLLFIGIAGAMEVWLYPERLAIVRAVYAGEVLVCIIGLTTIQLLRGKSEARLVVAASATMAAVLAACLITYASAVGLDSDALAMGLLCWITVVAVLLPWGGVAQAVVCVVVILGFLIASPFLSTEGRSGYAVLALLAASTGSVLGAISLERYRRAAFVHAARLERASALEREKSRTLTGLLEIGDVLSRQVGRGDGFPSVVGLAAELIGCDFVDLYALDLERQAYLLRATHGHWPEIEAELWRTAWSRDGFALGRTIRPGQQMEISDAAHQDPEVVPRAFLDRFRISSILYVPVARGGELAGLIACGHNRRVGPFSAEERTVAQGVASALGVALENLGLIDDLKAASRLKSEFISTMSHELRTPLNAIVGYTDLLSEEGFGPLTEDQADALERVRRGARRLTEMISATLDSSRLEAGRERASVDRVAMSDVVREIADALRLPADGDRLRVTWTDRTAERVLFTDRVKVKTILGNLVGNAIKFTPAGIVAIVVDLVDGNLQLEVRDTGVGIAAETLPVIFEMFRQGDASATRLFEGVGLGLYIVKRYVEILGGTIDVESVPGGGSTFVVRIPVRAEAVRAEMA